MKEKMLTKLERDRAVGQVAGLKSTLKTMDAYRGGGSAKNLTGIGASTVYSFNLECLKFFALQPCWGYLCYFKFALSSTQTIYLLLYRYLFEGCYFGANIWEREKSEN